MNDYKSPIEVVVDEMHSQIMCDYENGIMKAIQRYNINVDKDELIKALQYDRQQYEKGYQDGLNADKWIPCSDRLPKDCELVLVSLEQGFVLVGYHTEICGWYSQLGCMIYSEVIAWQPLPESYKKEEEQ